MNIMFYGQLGLPSLSQKDLSSPENRVEALARHLAAEGHNVTVLGTAPYLASGNFHGITLKRLPSLNPEKPGGWFYLGLGLFYILRKRPHVVHIHTWRAVFLATLARWFLRDMRIVWTISELPIPQFVVKLLTTHHQLLTTTNQRSLQYRLLVEYGVRATYVPDGYHQPVVPAISAARFGLRKEQYCVALVESPTALRAIAKAYKATKTRKKLVVLGLDDTAVKRLKRSYPFLTSYTLLITSRIRRSLLAQAAAVIVGDTTISHTVLLEAMHHQRPLIALNEPRYQEVLGTTARYWAGKRENDLTSTLKNLLGSAVSRQEKGLAARIRAQHHFTWPRVMEDYEILYAPQVRAVLIDSVQASQPVRQTGPRVQYS